MKSWIIGQTVLSREMNEVESWVKKGRRLISQTASNHESNRVNSWLKKIRISGQIGSCREMNEIES